MFYINCYLQMANLLVKAGSKGRNMLMKSGRIQFHLSSKRLNIQGKQKITHTPYTLFIRTSNFGAEAEPEMFLSNLL